MCLPAHSAAAAAAHLVLDNAVGARAPPVHRRGDAPLGRQPLVGQLPGGYLSITTLFPLHQAPLRPVPWQHDCLELLL